MWQKGDFRRVRNPRSGERVGDPRSGERGYVLVGAGDAVKDLSVQLLDKQREVRAGMADQLRLIYDKAVGVEPHILKRFGLTREIARTTTIRVDVRYGPIPARRMAFPCQSRTSSTNINYGFLHTRQFTDIDRGSDRSVRLDFHTNPSRRRQTRTDSLETSTRRCGEMSRRPRDVLQRRCRRCRRGSSSSQRSRILEEHERWARRLLYTWNSADLSLADRFRERDGRRAALSNQTGATGDSTCRLPSFSRIRSNFEGIMG